MIYTYRNFISTFLQIITWWYIYTATLYQFSCRWTLNDIYIPQLCVNFPAVEHLMIYTYRNLISIFLQMNTWWYIHTPTLCQFFCRWTPDDIYIRQLYINFPADEHVMIYTYRNFISTFLPMNSRWYIHTATLYWFSSRWTRDDIYITATLYKLSCRWTPDDFRELTKRRRRRQRRRYKTIGLVSKNNGFARSAHAFYIVVHFFAVIS